MYRYVGVYCSLLAGREKGRGRSEDRPLVYPLSPLDGVQLSGNRTLIPPSERSRVEYSGTPSSEPPLTLGVAVPCRLDPRSRRSLLVSEVLSPPRLLSGRYSLKLPVLSPSRACAPWGRPKADRFEPQSTQASLQYISAHPALFPCPPKLPSCMILALSA